MSILRYLSKKKIIDASQQGIRQQEKNVAKHLRIANVTSGHERDVHLRKAERLQTKYAKIF